MSKPYQLGLPAAMVLAICSVVSNGLAQDATKSIGPPPGNLEATAGEPVLAAVVRWGEQGVAALEKVDGYTATLIKRERIRGRLEQSQQMFIKIRHRPLSVYARFETVSGEVTQEVMYVAGQNRDRMWVHSERRKVLGTLSVYPGSRIALREGRYPITQIGLLELTKQLVEHARKALDVEDTKIQVYSDATINGRPTLALALTHAKPHKNVTYHHARVFIDREWNVPVRYEAYGFPSAESGAPRLLEQYTYLDLDFNVALTDADFDIRNPAYHFPIRESDEYDELAESEEAEESTSSDGPLEHKNPSGTERPPEPEPVRNFPAQPLTVAADFAAHIATAEQRLQESAMTTSLVIRQRRVAGKLNQGEFWRLKYRRQPLGVYLRGVWPKTIERQQMLYVANHNDAQAVTRFAADSPSVWLPLLDLQQRQQDHRPITGIGTDALLAEAVAMMGYTEQANDPTIRRYSNARIDVHDCVCFEITRSATHGEGEIYRRRIFFDKRRRIPIRFEMYSKQTTLDDQPQLVEAVTFRNVLLDARLTSQDFDATNPAYGFSPPPVAAVGE